MVKEILLNGNIYYYTNANGDLFISGIALAEGQWKEIYHSEDLAKIDNDLAGLPLLYEHGMDPKFQDMKIGEIIKSWYDKAHRAVMFLAKVTCRTCKEMLLSRELKSVSSGLESETIERNGRLEAISSKFFEVSLVHQPACTTCNIVSVRESLSKNIGESYMEIREELVWDESEEFIRHRIVDPDKFDKDSLRTIDIDAERGIRAVVGCPVGEYEGGRCKVGMKQQNVMFDKSKGWTMEKAKEWWEEHQSMQNTQSLSKEILSEDERKELNDLRKLKEIVDKSPEMKVLSEVALQRSKDLEVERTKTKDLESKKAELEAEKAKIPGLEAKIAEQDKAIKDSVDLIAQMKVDKDKELRENAEKLKNEIARKVEEMIPPKHILEGWKSAGAKRLVLDIKKKTKEIRE